MNAATQKAKILEYCRRHGSITVRDAFVKLRINSPTKRISEMRQSERYTVRAVTEENGNSRYARYYVEQVSQHQGKRL